MQLTYRGVAYQPQTTFFKTPASMQTGKYRGHASNIPARVWIQQPSLTSFTYRGVNYTRYVSDRHSQTGVKKMPVRPQV